MASSSIGYSFPGSSSPSGGGGTGDSADEDKGYSVAKLRRQYLDFASSKSAELEEQRTARHYYHGDQWTSTEVDILRGRKQPILTNNRVGRKIDGVVGLVERLRQDPKAYPRTPEQAEGAEVATEALRYVLDAQDWQPVSAESARNGSINGIAGLEIFLEAGDQGDPDIGFAIVDPETFFYDPRSKRFDFSDARYMGVAKWIDLDVAKEMFPDQAEELGGLVDTGGAEGWQQKDNDFRWVNTELSRVFLVEHWYQKASEWRFCFYVATTELKSGSSPFFDEKGKPVCRFEMYSVNIDHDGDRYGFVRNMKSAQDEINARRSKALNILNVRRIIMEEGATNDIEKLRKEAVRPDGVIVRNPGKELMFDDTAKEADLAGQLEFLNEAKQEIDQFGPNPQLMGQQDAPQSGRAIALLQSAGMAELGPFVLAYRGWKIRVYRKIWNAVQRYWTSERWIRVTDREGMAQFLPVNQMEIGEDGQPRIVNRLGALDVDIIMDEGPDSINMMQDTFDILQTLAQNGVPVPPAVFMELSQVDSRTKKKVLDLLNQPNPMTQIEQAQGTANVEKTQSETAKNKVSAAKDMHVIAMDHAGLSPELQPQPGPAQQPPKGPSESINYNDLPPEAQAAMLAQVGIHIHPAILAAHASEQVKQQAAMKAASRPNPASARA